MRHGLSTYRLNGQRQVDEQLSIHAYVPSGHGTIYVFTCKVSKILGFFTFIPFRGHTLNIGIF